MRWTQYIVFGLFIASLSCSRKVSFTSFQPQESAVQNDYVKNECCSNADNYIPASQQEVKTIQCCFHYMYDSQGNHNFNEEKARNYSRDLVKSCNKILADATVPRLEVDGPIPGIPKDYRFEISPTTNNPDDDGIYFHHDDDLYFFILRGKNKNRFSRKVVDRYAVKQDSFLNIFMMPHLPDSAKSKTYRPSRSGIALGNSIKLAGYYYRDLTTPYFAGVSNHEIGHVLGLSHTWSGNDGCDDTPRHNNCWNFEDKPPCDTLVSNNMMDYNTWQKALTPCQLGRVHRNLTRWSSKPRKLVKAIWCEKKENIVIRTHEIWNTEKDISGDLVIEESGTLTIKCRLSIPKNASIIVQPGGKLILDNCWLHNSCGDVWNGIKIGKKGSKSGKVETIGRVDIDNIKEDATEK